MSLIELGSTVFGPVEGVISYFRMKGLLASQVDCQKCHVAMVERSRSDVSDSVCWKCPRYKGTKSIRDKSFFSKSRITLQKWFLMILFWVREYPVTKAAADCKMGRDTAINIYQWLREVCSTALCNQTIVLGGPGIIVQIDESLYKHKPKVRFTVR